MNTTASGEAIRNWLVPLRLVLDPGNRIDWSRLAALTVALDEALAEHPVGADLPASPERSRRLRIIRRELAQQGHGDTSSKPTPFQLMAQFACGYRDIDLRDAIGLGHGLLIARHASSPTQRKWIPRLMAGELAGIAVTEPHGGSRPAETRTRAVAGPHGTWLITGRKTWISRLTEAAVFVLFFRTPDSRLAAATVDATAPGLHRRQIPPTGLAGWTWGMLDLDAVPIRTDDVLHGDGMALLRQHFAGYRPTVTATALGGAAAVFDTVTAKLAARQAARDVRRLRDSTLITLGRAHAQIVTALLGTVVAAQFADAGHDTAEPWAAAMKAHGIDTANSTAAELALLLGAAGFRADCQIAKVRRDLNGLLYADGIHDSLFRTAGKHHARSQAGADAAAVPEPRGQAVPVQMSV